MCEENSHSKSISKCHKQNSVLRGNAHEHQVKDSKVVAGDNKEEENHLNFKSQNFNLHADTQPVLMGEKRYCYDVENKDCSDQECTSDKQCSAMHRCVSEYSYACAKICKNKQTLECTDQSCDRENFCDTDYDCVGKYHRCGAN